jgi:hypothetical protein
MSMSAALLVVIERVPVAPESGSSPLESNPLLDAVFTPFIAKAVPSTN